MRNYKKLHRREFIKTASCGAIGSLSFYSTLLNLQGMSNYSILNANPYSNNDDYKALVCIMLRGGNDGFNMLVPHDNASYLEYQNSRSVLSIPREDLIMVNPTNSNGSSYGFHPSMPEISQLFEDGKLAVISNIGTLVQPTSKSDFINGAQLPTGLFSHSDQAHHWQTSVPQTSSPTGWAGRLADIVQSANLNQEISMNISLSGKNVFQLGNMTSEYGILPIGDGSVGITGFGGNSTFDQLRTSIVNSLMEHQYQDIFKQSYADIVKASQNAHELFSEAVAFSNLTTEFSESTFSQSLKMVARTIQVREQLGVKRQTFFIQMDGWDHHDDLLYLQEGMLEEFSKALAEFQAALLELDVENQVTSFTISDFGRTLTSNGDGSDHAWGSNVIVMGGQVNGKNIYGEYPQLALNSDQMLEGGILLPQLSTDEYFSELALWYGVAPSELLSIFPNLGNFYDVFSGNMPIGFMKS